MSLIRVDKYNIEKANCSEDISNEEKLINAIREGNAIQVRKLIKLGVNVNYKNYLGFTPLMYSAVTGIGHITKMLLNAGCETEITNNRGLTALEIALFNGSYEVFDILKENGANQELLNKLSLSNIEIEENRKYKSIDLIKREVYCDNDAAKELINNILTNIEKHKDLRIELIMACIALHTMESDFTNHNLKIFVTDNIDTSVFTGTSLKYGYLLGSYNWAKNIIQTSNYGGEIISTQTFLHELTHKVHFACHELFLEDINKASLEMKERLAKTPKNKGTEFIRKNMIERVNKATGYNELSLKLLEYLADTISYTIICNTHKKDRLFARTIKNILEPLYEVFDEKIAPQLKEYILQNKNLSKLSLSDELKVSLRKQKNKNRINSVDMPNRNFGIVAKRDIQLM